MLDRIVPRALLIGGLVLIAAGMGLGAVLWGPSRPRILIGDGPSGAQVASWSVAIGAAAVAVAAAWYPLRHAASRPPGSRGQELLDGLAVLVILLAIPITGGLAFAAALSDADEYTVLRASGTDREIVVTQSCWHHCTARLWERHGLVLEPIGPVGGLWDPAPPDFRSHWRLAVDGDALVLSGPVSTRVPGGAAG